MHVMKLGPFTTQLRRWIDECHCCHLITSLFVLEYLIGYSFYLFSFLPFKHPVHLTVLLLHSGSLITLIGV